MVSKWICLIPFFGRCELFLGASGRVMQFFFYIQWAPAPSIFFCAQETSSEIVWSFLRTFVLFLGAPARVKRPFFSHRFPLLISCCCCFFVHNRPSVKLSDFFWNHLIFFLRCPWRIRANILPRPQHICLNFLGGRAGRLLEPCWPYLNLENGGILKLC